MELPLLLYVFDKIAYRIIHSTRTFPQKDAVSVEIEKGVLLILRSHPLKYSP
jgi:hypothetical protein